MADQRVGILVEAIDKASAILRGIGKAGSAAMGLVGEGSSKAGAALKMMAHAPIVLNQAFALFQRTMMMVNRTLGETVRQSLAFRSANDPAVLAFKQMSREADILKARLGDILIPIILGVVDAYNEVADAVAPWLEANRKMIGTKVVEYMGGLGNVMITVVARAISLVAKAYAGWREIIDVVKIAVNEQFKAILQGAGFVVRQMAQVAATFGQTGLVKSLDEAHNAMAGLWVEFDKSSQVAQDDLGATVEAMAALDATIAGMEGTARRVLGDVLAAMQKRIEASTKSGTRSLEDQEKVIQRIFDRRAKLASLQQTIDQGMTDTQIANAERVAEIEGKVIDAQTRQLEASREVAVGISAAFGAAFQSMISGSENAGLAMARAIIQSAQLAVQSYIQVGMAASAAANAGIPGVGWIYALAASAIIGGIIEGFLAKIPKAAYGGVLMSGPTTGDRTPVFMNRGEGAFTARQMGLFERLARALENQGGQQLVAAGGGGGTVNLTMQSLTPATPLEIARAGRVIKKVINRR